MKLLVKIQDLTTNIATKHHHYIDIPLGMQKVLKQIKKLNGGVLYKYYLSEGIISLNLEDIP